MTDPSDEALERRLKTPAVAERDKAFTVSLLGKVRRDRRRGVLAAFLWVAGTAALVGLLGAGFYLGLAQAVRQTLSAVWGS
jgi:hypothetical protein